MDNLDATFRKDSMATTYNNGVLSPASSNHHAWDPQFGAVLATEPVTTMASTQFSSELHPFGPTSTAPPQGYYQHDRLPQQNQQWSMQQDPVTPAYAANFMHTPQQYSNLSYAMPPTGVPHDGYGQAAHMSFQVPPPDPNFASHPPHIPSPLSPHPPLDHMALAEQDADSRTRRRMRTATPQTTILDARKGDGVRKKNTRIDIPAGRDINNIDRLISEATDDSEVRELKSQKRLLRNREAALLSRQRKKKHTEDLEHKDRANENQLRNMEIQIRHLEEALEQATRTIMEQRQKQSDLILKHDEETGLLRRKIQILEEQGETGLAPPMSVVPSSTGFTELNASVEALTFAHHENIGPHEWDEFINANHVSDEAQAAPPYDGLHSVVQRTQNTDKKPSSVAVAPENDTEKTEIVSDQPIASGLLFMLLLCGAFVASKPPGSQPPGIPNMPAAVQAVAPAILNSLLESDPTFTQHSGRPDAVVFHEPQASTVLTQGSTSNRLDQIYRTVTRPTKQQEIDQVFSLTPAQYASITSDEYATVGAYGPQDTGSTTKQPRRTLADTLAAMEREHAHRNKAEVYTRSLLWDNIPADVVQQFKDMVRDHNELDSHDREQVSKSELTDDASTIIT